MSGQPTMALVCTNPACDRRGQHVQIHDDTALPVHCGGCFAVLHCQHQLVTRVETAGTLGAPVKHEITSCPLCNTELERKVTPLPPVNLAELPADIFDHPIGD